MTQDVEDEALGFFSAMHQAFGNTLAEYRGREDMLGVLLTQAFSSYEGNAEIQAGGSPEPDCHKGCATCCTIRVVATAPEVFLVARYIRSVQDKLKQAGIDMRQRLADADSVTRDQDASERVELRQRCPYIHQGACIIYPVRPLACRSHISYSKSACVEAAAGRLDQVPYSAPHMEVRSLVQNAMQSALRDAGYAWGTYELNHSLSITLDDESTEAAWLAGDDVFANALVGDVSLAEMASAFDHIHGRSAL
jgi:Fe-S-cluster containining protein